MESLSALESSLRELIDRYHQLQAENRDLQLTVADQREDLIKAYAEIQQLRTANRHLLVARSLSETDETREAARQQLTRIISKIDKALEVLHQ